MAEVRAQHPDFDITRTWTLPNIPVNTGDEPLDAYLTRIGFTPEQLQYTRRSWGNAACEDISRISAEAALQEMEVTPLSGAPSAGEGDFRVVEGYNHLHDYWAEGLDIRLNSQVTRIDWRESLVKVYTQNGDIFEAEKVLITLPLGTLKADTVEFVPSLPAEKQTAIDQLLMGPALKVMFRFAERITPEGIVALYSKGNPPMWWTPTPQPVKGDQVWMALATGNWARELLRDGEDVALDYALETLRSELNIPDLTPIDRAIQNWTADEYALGGYSVVPPGANGMREQLGLPIQNRLFWAGEATAPNHWASTVHGALFSARRAVDEMLAI